MRNTRRMYDSPLIVRFIPNSIKSFCPLHVATLNPQRRRIAWTSVCSIKVDRLFSRGSKNR